MLEDIKDVKPPVELPINHFLIFLIALILLSVGIVLVYLIIKRRNKVIPAPTDTRTPWEKAFDQLNELKNKNLIAVGKIKEYYSEMSDIVRQYFELRFKINAPEMTTEEFLLFIKNYTGLIREQKEVFKEFLNSCDMVKFAKHIPVIEEAEHSFQLAWRLIEETKNDF